MTRYRKPLLGMQLALLVLLTVAFLGSRGQLAQTGDTIIRVTDRDEEMETAPFDGALPDALRDPANAREAAAAEHFESFRGDLFQDWQETDRKQKAMLRRLGELYKFFSMNNIILILALGVGLMSFVAIWKTGTTRP